MTSTTVKRSFFGLGVLASLFVIIAYGFWGIPEKKEFPNKKGIVEIAEARTITSKVYRAADGQRAARFYSGPIHYQEQDGTLQDIDNTVVPSGRPGVAYEVEKGIYKAYFAPTFNAESVVDILDDDGVSISFQSQDLSVIKANGKKVSLKAPLAGSVDVDGNSIRYASAYGEGLDVRMQYEPERFIRELVIDSYGALGISEVQEAEEYIDLGFAFSLTLSELQKDQAIFIDGEEWNGEEKTDVQSIQLWDKEKEKEVFTFYRPVATDATEMTQGLFFHIIKDGDQVVITKLAPLGWLKDAAYPVRMDDTLNSYATADNACLHSGTTYSTVNTATTCATPLTGATSLSVGQNFASPTYSIYRNYFYFDTSSLTADASISAANLYIYGTADYSLTDFYIRLVAWNEGTAFSSGDYDGLGTTVYASLDTSVWSSSSYNTLAFTNTTTISKTATTNMGLRSSRDIAGTAPTQREYVSYYAVEQTGTANDPYLEVTYTIPNALPTATMPSPVQLDSDIVRFTTTIADSDLDATSTTIEYSTDSSNWIAMTFGSVTVDRGDITTSTNVVLSIDTDTNANVVLTVNWDIGTDLINTDDNAVYVRVTPHDGTVAGTTQTSAAFAVDTLPPTTAGSLTLNAAASSSLTLNLGSASSDTNFSQYKVYYKAGASGVADTDSAITSSTVSGFGAANFNGATTFTATGLTPGTQYVLNLYAYDTYGSYSNAIEVAAYTLAETPSAATITASTTAVLGLVTSAGSNPSTVRYTICRTIDTTSCVANGYVQADGTLGASAVWQAYTSWGGASGISVTGLSANTSYQFLVKARNSENTETSFSSASTATYTFASPITSIVVSDASTSSTLQARLSWSNADQTGMKIERDTGCDGSYDVTLYTNTAANDTSPTTTGSSLVGNTCYVYKMSSYNGNGQTSNTFSIATSSQFTTPPSQPTGLTTASAETASITWSWDSVAGATHYVVVTAGTNITIATTTLTSYQQTDLSPNTQYTVYVRANNSTNGTGVASSLASSYTDATTPSSITHSSQTTSALTFGWTTTAAESYARLADGSASIVQTKNWVAESSWSVTGLTANTPYTIVPPGPAHGLLARFQTPAPGSHGAPSKATSLPAMASPRVARLHACRGLACVSCPSGCI